VSQLSRYLRTYPTLLRIGLAEAVAYRAEFVVWMLATTMPLVMLAIMSAIAREGPIGGFDERAFVAYYLVTLVVRQMTGAWVAWDMVQEIKDGLLGMRLLRPIHPLVGFAANSMSQLPMRALVSLPVTILVLVVAARAHLTHDPVAIGIFVLSIAGAWILNFSVSAMIGTLGLFLESSLQVWELWMGGFMLLSGYLVPLALFPGWLQRIARVLPFVCLQAFPVETLTGMRDRHQALVGLAWQWGWAVTAFCGLLLLWRSGVKRFAAYGG
jgi:ABC-2 type transport system permease protein